jgi:hypothetical protein
MLTSKPTVKPRVPKLPSIGEIDQDIVACEVALFTLNSGSDLFDPERESLSRKLSKLLALRLHCERHGCTILRFSMHENAGQSGAPRPLRGLA